MLDATNMAQQRPASHRALGDNPSDLIDDNKRALVRWFQGTQALSDEVSSIVQTRMLLTMEAWSQLLACRSPEQVMELLRRFTAKAVERCADELTSLSQLALKVSSIERSK